jgi:hypothetical protein
MNVIRALAEIHGSIKIIWNIRTVYSTQKKAESWGMAEVVEPMLGKHKALSKPQ